MFHELGELEYLGEQCRLLREWPTDSETTFRFSVADDNPLGYKQPIPDLWIELHTTTDVNPSYQTIRARYSNLPSVSEIENSFLWLSEDITPEELYERVAERMNYSQNILDTHPNLRKYFIEQHFAPLDSIWDGLPQKIRDGEPYPNKTIYPELKYHTTKYAKSLNFGAQRLLKDSN